MPDRGICYCGAIEWQVVGKVDFTSNCHCSDCQVTSGSAHGTTSFMVYDPDGVVFPKGQPKTISGHSDANRTTERGFCGDCGSVLFNHVSRGQADEHWAVRTGGKIGPSKEMDKEISMRSKPAWVPSIQKPENQFRAMPGEH